MKIATLLSLSASAYGIAFDGPAPTPASNLLYEALNGWTPKPTDQPRSIPEIFRRQQKANAAMCGYINGDSAFPVTCTSASQCIFNASQKWFGCCDPSSPSSGCNIATRCIASASYSKCLDDASCYNDPLAIACTQASAPHCINMAAKLQDAEVGHWVCGAAPTSVAVKASATAPVQMAQQSAGVSPSPSPSPSPLPQGGSSGKPAEVSKASQGSPSVSASGGQAQGTSVASAVNGEGSSAAATRVSAAATGASAAATAGATGGAAMRGVSVMVGVVGVLAVLL